jgi:hypothetical protein
MCILARIRAWLAERRERRRRYAETLVFMSLPVKIQNDIRRPERPSERPAAGVAARLCLGM